MNRTIILADDDDSVRSLLAKALRRARWEVVEFADGTEALNAALAAPPDLVILDVSMPGMDGYRVLRTLRGNPQTRGILVFMLTGGLAEESEKLKDPPDGWIGKPFQIADVVRRIETAMLSRHERADDDRCAVCNAVIAPHAGRFRHDGKDVCEHCHDAAVGRGL